MADIEKASDFYFELAVDVDTISKGIGAKSKNATHEILILLVNCKKQQLVYIDKEKIIANIAFKDIINVELDKTEATAFKLTIREKGSGAPTDKNTFSAIHKVDTPKDRNSLAVFIKAVARGDISIAETEFGFPFPIIYLEGACKKKGKVFEASRYLVLTVGRLLCYRKPEDKAGGYPLNSVFLCNCTIADAGPLSVSVASKRRKYEFTFATPQNRDEWKKVLETTCQAATSRRATFLLDQIGGGGAASAASTDGKKGGGNLAGVSEEDRRKSGLAGAAVADAKSKSAAQTDADRRKSGMAGTAAAASDAKTDTKSDDAKAGTSDRKGKWGGVAKKLEKGLNGASPTSGSGDSNASSDSATAATTPKSAVGGPGGPGHGSKPSAASIALADVLGNSAAPTVDPALAGTTDSRASAVKKKALPAAPADKRASAIVTNPSGAASPKMDGAAGSDKRMSAMNINPAEVQAAIAVGRRASAAAGRAPGATPAPSAAAAAAAAEADAARLAAITADPNATPTRAAASPDAAAAPAADAPAADVPAAFVLTAEQLQQLTAQISALTSVLEQMDAAAKAGAVFSDEQIGEKEGFAQQLTELVTYKQQYDEYLASVAAEKEAAAAEEKRKRAAAAAAAKAEADKPKHVKRVSKLDEAVKARPSVKYERTPMTPSGGPVSPSPTTPTTPSHGPTPSTPGHTSSGSHGSLSAPSPKPKSTPVSSSAGSAGLAPTAFALDALVEEDNPPPPPGPPPEKDEDDDDDSASTPASARGSVIDAATGGAAITSATAATLALANAMRQSIKVATITETNESAARKKSDPITTPPAATTTAAPRSSVKAADPTPAPAAAARNSVKATDPAPATTTARNSVKANDASAATPAGAPVAAAAPDSARKSVKPASSLATVGEEAAPAPAAAGQSSTPASEPAKASPKKPVDEPVKATPAPAATAAPNADATAAAPAAAAEADAAAQQMLTPEQLEQLMTQIQQLADVLKTMTEQAQGGAQFTPEQIAEYQTYQSQYQELVTYKQNYDEYLLTLQPAASTATATATAAPAATPAPTVTPTPAPTPAAAEVKPPAPAISTAAPVTTTAAIAASPKAATPKAATPKAATVSPKQATAEPAPAPATVVAVKKAQERTNVITPAATATVVTVAEVKPAAAAVHRQTASTVIVQAPAAVESAEAVVETVSAVAADADGGATASTAAPAEENWIMSEEQQQQLAAQIEQLADYLKQWSQAIVQGHQLTPEQMTEFEAYQKQLQDLIDYQKSYQDFLAQTQTQTDESAAAATPATATAADTKSAPVKSLPGVNMIGSSVVVSHPQSSIPTADSKTAAAPVATPAPAAVAARTPAAEDDDEYEDDSDLPVAHSIPIHFEGENVPIGTLSVFEHERHTATVQVARARVMADMRKRLAGRHFIFLVENMPLLPKKEATTIIDANPLLSLRKVGNPPPVPAFTEPARKRVKKGKSTAAPVAAPTPIATATAPATTAATSGGSSNSNSAMKSVTVKAVTVSSHTSGPAAVSVSSASTGGGGASHRPSVSLSPAAIAAQKAAETAQAELLAITEAARVQHEMQIRAMRQQAAIVAAQEKERQLLEQAVTNAAMERTASQIAELKKAQDELKRMQEEALFQKQQDDAQRQFALQQYEEELATKAIELKQKEEAMRQADALLKLEQERKERERREVEFLKNLQQKALDAQQLRNEELKAREKAKAEREAAAKKEEEDKKKAQGRRLDVSIEEEEGVKGSITIYPLTTLEELRQMIADELDSPPADFIFLNSGVPVGRKQEAKTDATAVLPCVVLRLPGVNAATMISIQVKGENEPLGVVPIEQYETKNLEHLRAAMQSELDPCPANFNFLFRGAPLSQKQEAKCPLTKFIKGQPILIKLKDPENVPAPATAAAPAPVAAAAKPAAPTKAPPAVPIVVATTPVATAQSGSVGSRPSVFGSAVLIATAPIAGAIAATVSEVAQAPEARLHATSVAPTVEKSQLVVPEAPGAPDFEATLAKFEAHSQAAAARQQSVFKGKAAPNAAVMSGDGTSIVDAIKNQSFGLKAASERKLAAAPVISKNAKFAPPAMGAFSVLQGALATAMAKRRGVMVDKRPSVSMPMHPAVKRQQAMSSIAHDDEEWED